MSIASGKYTIVNVRQKNLAYLADPNDGTPVAANYEQNNKNEKASFPIILLLLFTHTSSHYANPTCNYHSFSGMLTN